MSNVAEMRAGMSARHGQATFAFLPANPGQETCQCPRLLQRDNHAKSLTCLHVKRAKVFCFFFFKKEGLLF